MKKIIQNRKVIIVLHESTTGPAHDLRDYLLKQNIEELLLIAHPLLYLKDGYKNASRFDYYKNGKLVESRKAFHWPGPEPLLYIKDTLYTLWWCLLKGRGYETFFGVGNLNAFAGILLKTIFKNTKVVYYVIDYVPVRFQNSLINSIYHRIERIAAQYSDWTWNLSPRMVEARNKKWQKQFPHQLVVPHGVHFERIKKISLKNVHKSEIMYMGSLLKKQGIQLVIQALPEIKKTVKDIKLIIIGRGPYEDSLKKLVNDLKLEKHVDFLGYLPNHSDMENRLAQSAIAIALYDKKHDEFSYYADPGKIKNYLGAGVPVIMTDVPYVALQVKEAKCGYVIPYTKNALVETIKQFMTDESIIQAYRKNALNFAKYYEWDLVFERALEPQLMK